MLFIMEMYVDGGCRRNGYSDVIGAAASLADLTYSFMAGGKLLLSFRSCLIWSVGVGFVYVGWMGMEGAVFAAGDGV